MKISNTFYKIIADFLKYKTCLMNKELKGRQWNNGF